MNALQIVTDENFADECPKHGGEVKKEYDFGMSDATVYTYFGCKCATVLQKDLGGFEGTAALCDSYNEAAGIARLQNHMNAVKCRD